MVPLSTVTPDQSVSPEPSSNTEIMAAPMPTQEIGQYPYTTDEDWVMNQPPQNFTIQLLAAIKPTTVKKFIANNQLRGVVHTLRTNYDNKKWQVVITGSYPNHQEALREIKQLAPELQELKLWVRNFDSLHKIMIRPSTTETAVVPVIPPPVVMAPAASKPAPPKPTPIIVTSVVAASSAHEIEPKPELEPIPEPVISNFSIVATTITSGTSISFTAEFMHGKGRIDNGVGAITSGEVIRVSPTTNTTYTLTATNAAGATARRSLTVTVLPKPETTLGPKLETMPEISSFWASATTVAAGNSITLTAIFPNGNGVVDNGIGTIASGVSIRVTPTADTTYTLTVTDGAGKTNTRSVTVTVAADTEADKSPTPVAPGRSARGEDAINWIMERNPDHYAIHLFTASSLDEMTAFTQGRELPSHAAFYNLRSDNGIEHILLYGDFAIRDDASASITYLDSGLRKGGAKIRKFDFIQKEIDERYR
jgi:septal ring-binding cell division protein DamX